MPGDPGARPLSRYQFLDSSDVDRVRDRVAQVYCRHRLDPVGPQRQVRAWQNIAKLSRLSVGAMSYGGDVRVLPGCLDRFFLAMLPYSGSADIETGAWNVRSCPATATILSPTDAVNMTWSADCAKLMVRIERESLEQHLIAMIGRPLREPLRFVPAMPNSARGALWWRYVRLMIDELEQRTDSDDASATLGQLETLLLTNLLESQPHNYSDALHGGACRIAPGHVRRAERYIEEHAHQAIGIEELVAVSGVSARALYDGYQRFRGTSPMAHLRFVRLQRVREELLAGRDDLTVAEVATRWCFFEFGRFAGQYRKLFGETPSQTLRARR